MRRSQSGSTLGDDPPLDYQAAAADRDSRDAQPESSDHQIAAHTTLPRVSDHAVRSAFAQKETSGERSLATSTRSLIQRMRGL